MLALYTLSVFTVHSAREFVIKYLPLSCRSAEASTGTAALSTESGEQKQTEAEAEESGVVYNL